MGLMGIQLRIALKNEVPPDFELLESKQETTPNTTSQSVQDPERQETNNTLKEISPKKQRLEINNQNVNRQQQKPIPKSQDIKDKSMDQNKVKEKGSVLLNTK
jgi:hypothetical protein